MKLIMQAFFTNSSFGLMQTFGFSATTIPPHLKKGNKVAITCPAKKLTVPITDAINLLQSWGLEVILGSTVTESHHQFAGNDEQRAGDMQRFIDDDNIKAIFAARGGYGTIRMIDLVNFSRLATNPKWIIGFSDITLLHSHLISNYNLACIHGQMPLTIPDASARSLKTLHIALFGETLDYEIPPHKLNRMGEGNGAVIGGNLSLLVATNGSVSDVDYAGKILFIEDVGEHYYSVDRMLRCLKRAGKLKNLAALVVGAFTEMKDFDTPFGQTVPEIVMDVVTEYNYPVCFDFPAGHVTDNRSLILGQTATLSVKQDGATLSY